MQNNKIKRVRSAASFKQNRSEGFRTTIKTQENNPNVDRRYSTLTAQFNRKYDTNLQGKQTDFAHIFKRLSPSPKKGSSKRTIAFEQYSSKSWRTINSARSLTRLQSLKQLQKHDPIKLNLNEKVLRIKSKHSDNQMKHIALKNVASINPEQKQSLQHKKSTHLIASQIRQIIRKWQKSKLCAIDQYNKKKISIFFNAHKTRKQSALKWEID